MKDLTVKKEFIGACTSVPGIGQIKIREDHAGILAQAGRWELLDGDKPNVKKLVPVAKEAEPVKSEITEASTMDNLNKIKESIPKKKKAKGNAATD